MEVSQPPNQAEVAKTEARPRLIHAARFPGRALRAAGGAAAARWRARAEALIGTDPPATPADEEAFERYANESTARFGQILLVLSAALALLLWPSDSLFLREEPLTQAGLAAWRMAFIAAALAGYTLLAVAARTRHAARIQGLILIAMSAGTLYWFGTFSDPNAPWIHNAIVLPAFTLTILVSWPERAVILSGLVASYSAAYLAPHPAYLHYPHLGSVAATAMMSALFNLGAGHLFYRLVHSHFVRGRALERLATTDSLTALSTRAAFLETAERELDRATRYGRPLAVLILDIDRFKSVNDTHGHAAGDRVLARLGGVLASVLRRSDVAGRLGGDELAVLLPENDAATAAAVAERIRAAFASRPADGDDVRACTVSIGVAARADGEIELAALVRRADQALYAAKRGGRDRVAIADPALAAKPH
ncbi:MAG: GGDEF domain-containing protein [Deltaproteobacteria bacterium]|nr:GGDEF domain-containing protein [Deltaproteobacteria bacterium]